MAAPHNPARIGETWDPDRLAAMLEEIDAVKEHVIISGGWGWHFMTPVGHLELKHAHDHKDADLFVAPAGFGMLVALLKNRGFERAWTRFDRLEGSGTFYRYSKGSDTAGGRSKIVFDLFAEEVPSVESGGVRVVEPEYLLSLYGKKHSSEQCFSVQIARRLIAKGICPVGRSEMADFSEFLPTNRSK